MADKNTENENGDDHGYGSQRKDLMDAGLTPTRKTQKGADENKNEIKDMKTGQEMANRTGISIWTKHKTKRSNT
jgi:hypothetical protein